MNCFNVEIFTLVNMIFSIIRKYLMIIEKGFSVVEKMWSSFFLVEKKYGTECSYMCYDLRKQWNLMKESGFFLIWCCLDRFAVPCGINTTEQRWTACRSLSMFEGSVTESIKHKQFSFRYKSIYIMINPLSAMSSLHYLISEQNVCHFAGDIFVHQDFLRIMTS